MDTRPLLGRCLLGIHARGELMQRNKVHPWTIVEDGGVCSKMLVVRPDFRR